MADQEKEEDCLRMQEHKYTELMTPQDRILTKSVEAKNFGEILKTAYEEIGASIVLLDAMEYVLAASPDLLDEIGMHFGKNELNDAGYAIENASVYMDGIVSVEKVSGFLKLHTGLETRNQMQCVISDILDGDSVLMKMMLYTKQPLNNEQKHLFFTLAMAIKQAFYRIGPSAGGGEKTGFLLNLIQMGALPESAIEIPKDFDIKGTFRMICLDAGLLGRHNRSFMTRFPYLMDMPQVLYAVSGDLYVILLNVTYQMSLLDQMDAFAKEHKMVMMLSEAFYNIEDTRSQFLKTSQATAIANRFHDACGLKSWSEYSMFQMFDDIRRNDQTEIYLHQDATKLRDHDAWKHSQYTQTAFCYLLFNCDAPAAAKALSIHRNTLDKRLHKIEELVHADWKNVSYQIRMLFSLYQVLREMDELVDYRSVSKKL